MAHHALHVGKVQPVASTALAGGYLTQGAGWSKTVVEMTPEQAQAAYDRKLSEKQAGGYVAENSQVSSDNQPGARDARQRAIEECAEEAYEHALENELVTAADYDRPEQKAARLREAILALGEKEA